MLICKGDEVAPEVSCQCPPNYEGRLCENRIENITRICDRITNVSLHHLKNCNSTSMKCVTYSKNRNNAYICQEANTPQSRYELPSCLDAENTTQGTISSDPNQNKPEKPYASWTGIFSFLILLLSALAVFVFIVCFIKDFGIQNDQETPPFITQI
uniref:Uncharacterized protein LOC111113105 n=1 Tax=Crassostrea virginica TaxID=6565 RepID=A0A8B8BV78_CRAVI|nr:uncharacterized protein LOC111113105 [Crassostrea virginica]